MMPVRGSGEVGGILGGAGLVLCEYRVECYYLCVCRWQNEFYGDRFMTIDCAKANTDQFSLMTREGLIVQIVE